MIEQPEPERPISSNPYENEERHAKLDLRLEINKWRCYPLKRDNKSKAQMTFGLMKTTRYS